MYLDPQHCFLPSLNSQLSQLSHLVGEENSGCSGAGLPALLELLPLPTLTLLVKRTMGAVAQAFLPSLDSQLCQLSHLVSEENSGCGGAGLPALLELLHEYLPQDNIISVLRQMGKWNNFFTNSDLLLF